MDKTTVTYISVFFLGVFIMLLLAIIFTVTERILILRAVGLEYAHYHPQTAELVWDDSKVQFIIMGSTE